MDYKYIKVDVDGRIFRITISRPEVMNALHRDASREMGDAFRRYRDDPDLWVAILTGVGERAFSAGNDLKATAASGARAGERVPFGGIAYGFECDKPIIAAVNGVALGGGFELALACDVIVASRTARFGLPEPKVGFVAAAGGMQRLPQHVGLKVAMGLMLTGRLISADEAYAQGIVNEVVEPGQLAEAADRWAADMCRCSPVSLRLTKACVRAASMPIDDALRDDVDSGRLAELFVSADHHEGVQAFNEKRAPVWTGR